MADDDVVLVCMRVDEALPASILPTSTITHCHRCKADVYIAPSGVELLAAHPLSSRILCNPCALDAFEEEGPPESIQAAPGAFDEVRAMGIDPDEAAAAVWADRAREMGRRRRRRR